MYKKFSAKYGILLDGDIESSSSSSFSIYSKNDIPILLKTNTSTTILNLSSSKTILENGNLGIGISDPQHKIDVNGNVNISSGSLFLINGQPHTHSWSEITDDEYLKLEPSAFNNEFIYSDGIDFIGKTHEEVIQLLNLVGKSEQITISSDGTSSIDLSNSPKSIEYLSLFKNGMILRRNIDYTLSGTTITLNTGVDYFYTNDDVYVEYYI